jgi:hypothetical protein
MWGKQVSPSPFIKDNNILGVCDMARPRHQHSFNFLRTLILIEQPTLRTPQLHKVAQIQREILFIVRLLN